MKITFYYFFQLYLLFQALSIGVAGNRIIGDVLYVHSGLDSKIILREVREGNVPLDLKIDDVVKKDHFNFIINLDAVEYINSQNVAATDSSHGDESLIQLAQQYIPPESLASTSIGERILTGVANLVGPYVEKLLNTYSATSSLDTSGTFISGRTTFRNTLLKLQDCTLIMLTPLSNVFMDWIGLRLKSMEST